MGRANRRHDLISNGFYHNPVMEIDLAEQNIEMVAYKFIGADIAEPLIEGRAARDVGEQDGQVLDAQAFALGERIVCEYILEVWRQHEVQTSDFEFRRDCL